MPLVTEKLLSATLRFQTSEKIRTGILRGALKPGESRPFRLPFDDIPAGWNNQMPQLVIAHIEFA